MSEDKRQYFHHNHQVLCDKFTIAIDVPTDIENLDVGDFIVLRVGLAMCHEKDNYNKSIGRQVAEGRMISSTFIVCHKGVDMIELVNTTLNKVFSFRKSHLIRVFDANYHI